MNKLISQADQILFSFAGYALSRTLLIRDVPGIPLPGQGKNKNGICPPYKIDSQVALWKIARFVPELVASLETKRVNPRNNPSCPIKMLKVILGSLLVESILPSNTIRLKNKVKNA
jgi:hypothetical protein